MELRRPAALSALRHTLGEKQADEALKELEGLIRPDKACEVDGTVLYELAEDIVRTRGAMLKIVGSGLHLRRPQNHVHGHTFQAAVVNPARKRLAAAARLQAAGSYRRANGQAAVALRMLRGGFAAAHGLEPHEEILHKRKKEKKKKTVEEGEKKPHIVERQGKLAGNMESAAHASGGDAAAALEPEPEPEQEPAVDRKEPAVDSRRPGDTRPALWESARSSRTRVRKEKRRFDKENPEPSHDDVSVMLGQSHALLWSLKDTAPPAKQTKPKVKAHGPSRLRSEASTAPERSPSTVVDHSGHAPRAAETNSLAHTQAKILHWSHKEMARSQEAAVFGMIHSAIQHKRSLFGHAAVNMHKTFELMDGNSDGTLDRQEFGKALTRLDLGLTEVQLAEVVELADANGDGRLNYGEFHEQLLHPNERHGLLGQSQSLPDIRHGRGALNTAGARNAQRSSELKQKRRLHKHTCHNKAKKIAQAQQLYMTDQAAEFDRTVAVTSKEGLSMQWNAQTFSQITAELSLGDDFDTDDVLDNVSGPYAQALAAGDGIAFGMSKEFSEGALSPPPEGREAQYTEINVAFGDQSVVETAAAASDDEANKALKDAKSKRTAAMDAVWGAESLAPGELTPRRKGWNADKDIYESHIDMIKANKNPLRQCVLEAGATLDAAPRAHAESLQLPRHATNRFRAVTPDSCVPNGARERPAEVLSRGHHSKEGQPDYLDTQNSFVVPKDWYVATVDSTPSVRLPRKAGAPLCLSRVLPPLLFCAWLADDCALLSLPPSLLSLCRWLISPLPECGRHGH